MFFLPFSLVMNIIITLNLLVGPDCPLTVPSGFPSTHKSAQVGAILNQIGTHSTTLQDIVVVTTIIITDVTAGSRVLQRLHFYPTSMSPAQHTHILSPNALLMPMVNSYSN